MRYKCCLGFVQAWRSPLISTRIGHNAMPLDSFCCCRVMLLVFAHCMQTLGPADVLVVSSLDGGRTPLGVIVFRFAHLHCSSHTAGGDPLAWLSAANVQNGFDGLYVVVLQDELPKWM